tara:strand:+ start:508 stop:1059 length:552 start_codon:yes stop_codon:yes gene_type:complete
MTSRPALLSAGVVTLCLAILPDMLMIARGFADRTHLLLNRCELLQGVQKTIDSNDGWTVLARREHPDRGEWSLVATCDRDPDSQVVPESIIVFESVFGSEALTVSHRIGAESPLESLCLLEVGDSAFVHRLRGDLDYQIHAFQTRSPRDVIRVVRMILAERVREQKQPDLFAHVGSFSGRLSE